MKNNTLESGDFIFRENDRGALEFVGDFNGLYSANDDPWSQSGQKLEWSPYYSFSRARITNELTKYSGNRNVLEVGCGLGFVVKFLSKKFSSFVVDGLDISQVAIEKAKIRFPDYNFIIGDITAPNFKTYRQYDIILLNQILWYVLVSLKDVMKTCHDLLSSSGNLIISQAFLKTQQKYGREIIDGFEGLKLFMVENLNNEFTLISEKYDANSKFKHNDGLLVYRKR